MSMFTLSVTIQDIEADNPEEAARAIVDWIRDEPDKIFVRVTDQDSLERMMVEVNP